MPRQSCRAGQGLCLIVLFYDVGLRRGQVQPLRSTVKLYFGFEVRTSFLGSSGWENNAAPRYDPSSCLMFILQISFLHPFCWHLTRFSHSFLASFLQTPALAVQDRVGAGASNNNHKAKNPCTHLLCRS